MDELYCYEEYRGYDIFVESCFLEDSGKLLFFGEIRKDDITIGVRNESGLVTFESRNGEVCLDKCKTWIDDYLLEEELVC